MFYKMFVRDKFFKFKYIAPCISAYHPGREASLVEDEQHRLLGPYPPTQQVPPLLVFDDPQQIEVETSLVESGTVGTRDKTLHGGPVNARRDRLNLRVESMQKKRAELLESEQMS